MKVALPSWNGRISPLFDTAQTVLVVEVEGGQPVSRHEEPLATMTPAEKVARLASLGVNVLVCGAISGCVAALVEAARIELWPWLVGEVEEVLRAFLEGRLGQDRFFMPGCRGRGRRFRAGCPWTP